MNRIMQLLLQSINKQEQPVELESAESLAKKREEAKEYFAQRGITQPKGIYNDQRTTH